MNFNTKSYIVHVRHDNGEFLFLVGARNKEVAREMVMAFERCPRRAIRQVVLA